MQISINQLAAKSLRDFKKEFRALPLSTRQKLIPILNQYYRRTGITGAKLNRATGEYVGNFSEVNLVEDLKKIEASLDTLDLDLCTKAFVKEHLLMLEFDLFVG